MTTVLKQRDRGSAGRPPNEASTQASFAFCHRLATSHYENFPVLSSLLPMKWRDDFAAVYAYCRTADDAADELDDHEESLRELAAMHTAVDACYDDDAAHERSGDLFPAVGEVIGRHQIPREPWHHLLNAFERDQTQTRYETWDEVLDYCTGSANPVGRLVLYVTGHGRHANVEALFRLSDATCTALQLTNHWQDVSRDLQERDRIYIPREIMAAHGISEADLSAMVERQQADDRFRAMMRDLVDRTRPLFAQGRGLWDGRGEGGTRVDPGLRPVLRMFTLGGEYILRSIERQGYDVLSRRPTLGRWAKGRLVLGTWIRATVGRVTGSRKSE